MGLLDSIMGMFFGTSNAPSGAAARQQPQRGPAPQNWAQAELQRHWDRVRQLEAEGIASDLAGLHPMDFAGCFAKIHLVSMAEADGIPHHIALQRNGIRDDAHYERIQEYFNSRGFEIGVDEGGQPALVQSQAYQNAMLQGAQLGMQQLQAQAAAANPNLLAPVDGVTIDQWGGASAALAALGAGASQQQLAQALARYGLDQARYDAANSGWSAKMQTDSTGVIAQKFTEAFAGPSRGAAPGGGDPCTLDRFCEIMAAQQAWAAQGFDVNAQLQRAFGVTAYDYSMYSTYWMPKIQTDMALVNRMTQLQAHFSQKYAGADPDADLRL